VASAASVLARLVAEVEADLDPMVAAVGDRIRADVPAFRRLPSGTLEHAVRGNVGRALDALREVREPTADELERAADVGRERAEQGLPVEAVLHAYRISVGAVWSRFGEVAREHGADVPSVLAFSETLWRWADAVMDVVATAHREVELEQAREEQQRRDAFVVALLTGGTDPTTLAADLRAHGLDAERRYVPFRARCAQPGGVKRRTALDLAGPDGLVTTLDHDAVGIAADRPDGAAGVTVGVGTAVEPAGLSGSFVAASRALTTALAFGQEGVFDLADLSVRPAILADDVLGDAFVARYLDPLGSLGRLGADLETTLRAWFDTGMRTDETARVLHLHPNTLRHRMKRFEDATGADLHRAADLVELWWALERRRLRQAQRSQSASASA
jgi:hypothetical protein